MLLPTQKVFKSLLAMRRDECVYNREDLAKKARARVGAAKHLVCSACGLSATQDECKNILALSGAPSSQPYEVGLQQLFRFSYNVDGLLEGIIDDEHGEILCAGCFDFENSANPHAPKVTGDYGFGLYGELSQDQLLYLWRAFVATAHRHKEVASGAIRAWSQVATVAFENLGRATNAGDSRGKRVSSMELCTWGALTQRGNWEDFQCHLADFRFVPPAQITTDLIPYAELLSRSPEFANAEAAALPGVHSGSQQPAV